MRKIWRRKIPIYYFCFIFVLWSQERCFIHAENFHRNKLKLSSCILFGYPRSHCKNAVWCLANRESWMWTGVPEHPLNYFFLGVQSFCMSAIVCKKEKNMATKKQKEKNWKNLPKIKCFILPLSIENWNYPVPSNTSLLLFCLKGIQVKHRAPRFENKTKSRKHQIQICKSCAKTNHSRLKIGSQTAAYISDSTKRNQENIQPSRHLHIQTLSSLN